MTAIETSPSGADGVPAPLTIPEALRRAAQRWPDAEAAVVGDLRMGWAELDRRSGKVAAGLAALGLRAGDRVGIFMPNAPEWIVLFHALAKLRAVAVPIHLRYKAPEIAHIMRRAGVSLLCCKLANDDRDYSEILSQALEAAPADRVVVLGEADRASFGHAFTGWDVLEASEAAVPESAAGPEDLVLIQHTSGTTGLPKGVELRHHQLLMAAAGLAGRMGMSAGDRLYSPMPFFHIGGTAASLLASLVSGATLVFSARFDAARALETLVKEGCTHVCGVEAMMVDIIGLPEFAHADLSRLRSGWTNRNVRVFDAFPGIINVYALSECSSAVSMCSHDDDLESRRDTCGRPLPGLEVRVCDPVTHEPVAAGENGAIHVRGWCVTSGYHNDPEATRAVRLAGGWFDTGDFGSIDAAGRLSYLGRLKDVLRVGGENVGSLEIEAALNAHPAVVRSAVVPVPHPRLQEVPCAFVELAVGAQASEQELIAHCAERMARFKVPRHVLFVTSFEMTETNKIIKQPLRALAAGALAPAGSAA